MNALLSTFSIQVNKKLYIKDPESSELGKRIIRGSIDLLYGIGFEEFNFRKLALNIKSTEASIYRYFESKHKVLLYLNAWYWTWMEYKLLFSITNIESAEERLERAINLLTEKIETDKNFAHIDESKLHEIVVCESMKAYLHKGVDQENKIGAFHSLKQFVQRLSEIVLEINPAFKYPHMLISTLIEGAHLQSFYANHLPRLTDNLRGEDSINSFYKQMVFNSIQK